MNIDYPVTTVFTFGAGVQWFEAYAAGQQHNRIIVGGYSERGSVGAAGGWLQGGGHGAIAPKYGLGKFKPVRLDWGSVSHMISSSQA